VEDDGSECVLCPSKPVLPEAILQSVLTAALAKGGDFAEVYAQDRTNFSIGLEDRKVERVNFGRHRGVGIRVVSGEVTGYAYTDDLQETSLLRAAAVAGAVGRSAARDGRVALRRRRRPAVAREAERPELFSERERADLVRAVDESARGVELAIRQVSVRLAHLRERVTIANSEGLLVGDERLEVQLSTSVTAQRGDLLQVGRRVRGGQAGLEVLRDPGPEQLGREAAGVAITLLDARPAPAGKMPVVVSNGWGGVLFHEAVGHGLEADHVVKNSSVYVGKIGQRVADPLVTLVDDATLPKHRGSFRFDDEGSPGRRTYLVEEGVLQAYLTDRKSADKLRLPRTGNGRRQSFQHLPIPRMTNLFITPGKADPDDIVRDTRQGLYVASLGGGMVDPTSGQFVFSVTEGYLIENGRIGPPVRGASLAGDSFRVLADIDAVANNFALDPGLGTCGKGGQWVPVGVGQPTLRVRELIVGGTA
jgi:TldD protein